MSAGSRPTMIDVARHAGVSFKTVSRVINNQPNVAEDLTSRVLNSIEELGFRRNDVAASLRAGTTEMLALVTGDLENSFYSRVATGVMSAARSRGHHVVMSSTQESAENERAILLDLCQRRMAGLIVVPTSAEHPYLEREIRMGTKVVFLDRPAPSLEADSVVLDNRGGARAVVQTLLDEGHVRIGVVSDALNIFTFGERLAGVKEAFAAAGLPWDSALVEEGLRTPDDARMAVNRLSTLPDPPTAIFAANNRMTIGAVVAVRQGALPLDVVGFDDFELSELLPMQVTLVSYDAENLGRRAAELLFARLAGDTSPPKQEVIPTILVKRGSDVLTRNDAESDA